MRDVTEQQKSDQAHAIHNALGSGEWTYHALPGDSYPSRILTHKDGYGIRLHWGVKDGRIEISGKWPATKRGQAQTPYKNAPSITVGIDRPAAAIVKEIRSRFLPIYLPLFAEQLKRTIHADQLEEQSNAYAAALREEFACPEPSSGDRLSMAFLPTGPIFSAAVTGDSVRFEAFSVPFALARQILRLTTPPTPAPETTVFCIDGCGGLAILPARRCKACVYDRRQDGRRA